MAKPVNITIKKIKGNRVGVYFGTFAPFHSGHYQNVIRAKRETDGCVVVVSGRKGDRGEVRGMDLLQRERSTRELFSDDENVSVTNIKEDSIPEMPHGWVPWMELLEEAILPLLVNPDAQLVWYMGEKEYIEEFKKLRPHYETVLVDRRIIPVSATQIAADPIANWDYISRPFRKYLSKNYLVMGSPSTGKSTLVRDLARTYNAPFSEETARTYEPLENIRDDELFIHHLWEMGLGMFLDNRDAIKSAGNNGRVVCDTDITTTEYYTKYYCTEEEYEMVRPMFEYYANREKWEKIFVIPPITEFVDDGFRDMNQIEERWEMHNGFMDMIKKYGWEDKVVLLDDPTYYGRYLQAKKVMDEI